ncbi:MAG TPA: phosphatase PAP2 family protein [Acidimicrobiales bacterium]|jgi:membrane-associated phospholipid phosphatase|nr:phosphatase PAP2 family protein [Acidimicrobiales bacterium]
MSLAWLAFSGAGLAILAASIVAARRPHIPRWEVRVFHAVNGLPGWLYWILWLPMQLGNLVVGTLVGLACAWVAREPAVAVGVVLAMILKLVTERIVRREMKAYLAVRKRPGSSHQESVLRGGDVPSKGPSFPSGHVILVAAIGCVVAPTLPVEWVWVPFLLTALVMLGRVYVGAHNPLDVTAGLGAGLLLGGVLAAFVG